MDISRIFGRPTLPPQISRSAQAKTAAKAGLDTVIAAIALQCAYLLRFNGTSPVWDSQMFVALAVVIIVKGGIGFAAGTYRPMWRYTSLYEAVVLGASSITASAALLLLSVIGWLQIPAAVLLIDAFLYPAGAVALRAMRRGQVKMMLGSSTSPTDGERGKAIFVGAGDSANALLAELEHRNQHQWDVVGILDDDPSKVGATLRGYRVLGPTTQLETVIARNGISHVVIAMPSADPSVVRRLISRARTSGATVLSVPAGRKMLLHGGEPAPPTVADLLDSTEIASRLRANSVPERPFTLVTGGAGYIGSHLVRMLLSDGHRVRVLDNFTYGDRGLDAVRNNPDLEIVHGDISSIRDIVAAVKDVDAVIALAAIVGDPACGLNAEETLNLNYESTKVLVEACSFYNVARLVFASSCSVYGAADDTLLTENSPLNPVSLYARTRILSENVIFSRCGDVTPVVLRLSTVFGQSPRMRYDLVVNTLTARAVVDGRIQIQGGDQWRPFVHCQDAALAFKLALTAPDHAVSHQIFNVGSSQLNYRIDDVGTAVASIVPGVHIDNQSTIEDRRNYRVSFDKIRDALGFVPVYDLDRGIREMVEALQDPNLRDYNRIEYSNVKTMQTRLGLVAPQPGAIRIVANR